MEIGTPLPIFLDPLPPPPAIMSEPAGVAAPDGLLIANPPLPEGRPPCLAGARARGACKDGDRVKLYSRPGDSVRMGVPRWINGTSAIIRGFE